MARKRPLRDAGTVVVLEHRSQILADNPLGDPHVRKLGVWLPREYDDRTRRSRPALPGALRPRRLHRLGSLAPELEAVQREPGGARGPAGSRWQDGPGDPGVSRLLHGAGRQPVREFVRHRPLRRLPRGRDHSVRRPGVPHARAARAPGLLRQVVGRLRRHDARHAIHGALGRDRQPFGRCVLRLPVPGRLAEHAERTREVSQTRTARPGAVSRAARYRCRACAAGRAATTAACAVSSSPSGAGRSSRKRKPTPS